ncbi:MAG: hypothetical protein HQL06_16175 [Nitrospirae bacterium]|nr:hypothetical protein [Nitrospirota bacterium]
MFIKSKLIPPTMVDLSIIPRLRLFQQFDKFTKSKLTIIACPGGWGKTVLALSYVKSIEHRYVWYNLDETDSDVVTFVTHLIYGINNNCGIVKETQDALNLMVSGFQWKYILSTLFNELIDSHNEKITIVFDDYHTINSSKSINEVLEYMLRYSPPNINFIISTREKPDIYISKSRLYGSVIDIDLNAIAFDNNEIDKLFLDIYSINLSETEIELIQRYSEGWVVCLQAIGISLKGRHEKNRLEFLKNHNNVCISLSEFFYEEIYSKLSDDLMSFMRVTSLPNKFNAELYRAMTNREDARLINTLIEKELFIVKIDENGQWYRYHHIIQEFLRQQLIINSTSELIETFHKRAAEYFHKDGDWHSTIYHLIHAKEYDRVSDMFNILNNNYFYGKMADSMLHWISDIPDDIVNSNCSLLLNKGWAEGQLGNLDYAIELMTLAKNKAIQKNDLKTFGSSFYCLMNTCFQNEQLPVSFEEINEDLYKNNTFFNLLRIYISIQYFYLNEPNKIKDYNDALLSFNDSDKNDNAYMTVLACHALHYDCFMGRIKQAINLIDDCMRSYSKSDDTIGNNFLFAEVLFEAGYYIESKHFFELSVKSLNAMGNIFYLRSTLAGLAINEFYLNNIKMAHNLVERLKNIDKENKRWSFSKKDAVSSAFALLAFHENEKDIFYHWAEDAIKYSERLNVYYYIYKVNCWLAPCYASLGNVDKAVDLLERSIQVSMDLGNPYAEARSRIILASILYDNREYSLALEHLSKSIEISELNEYDFLFNAKEKSLFIELLPFILENSINFDFVINIAIVVGEEVAKGLIPLLSHKDTNVKKASLNILTSIKYRHAEKDIAFLLKDPDKNIRSAAEKSIKSFALLPPEPIKVYTLGSFQLYVGDRQIHPNEWSRKSAQNLCKYFIFHSGKEITNDKLIDTFWQDEDATSGKRNFLVGISTLRKVLEPGIPPKKKSSYIKHNNGMYSFIIPDGSYIDVCDFEHNITMADRYSKGQDNMNAKSHYIRAVELYKGDFLEEDIYNDWSFPMREQYLEMYMKALKKLAYLCYKSLEYSITIEYINHILKKDEYDDFSYHLLMKTHTAMGNKHKAIDIYHKYCNVLRLELNTKPSNDITSFYQKISAK